METATDIIFWACTAMMCVAALLTLGRLAKGPSGLDRVVSLDLLTAVAIALTAILIAGEGRSDLAVLLVIFALTGFFSSVVVARFTDAKVPESKELHFPQIPRAVGERCNDLSDKEQTKPDGGLSQ